jgi:hypothetical protein
MKLDPAKHLITAGIIALGLSGGVAMAAYAPDVSSAVGSALARAWMNTAQNGGPNGSDLFSAAATYIGVSADQLRTELGTDKSLADVAVAHGKTRDGLIQALVAADEQKIATLVDQKGIGVQTGPRGPGGISVIGDQLAAAATYLGTSTADLQTKLQSGQTLAQIAEATSGKSRDGLIAAMVDDAKAKIAAAQQAGTITANQATELNDALTDRVTRRVDSTRPLGPHFGR